MTPAEHLASVAAGLFAAHETRLAALPPPGVYRNRAGTTVWLRRCTWANHARSHIVDALAIDGPTPRLWIVDDVATFLAQHDLVRGFTDDEWQRAWRGHGRRA